MAKERAEVEVDLSGTDGAVSNVRKLDDTINQLGKHAITSGRDAAASLLGMAGGALKAAAALGGLSIVGAVEQAKQLDLQTARLGQSAGVSGNALRSAFDAVEKKTLTSSIAMSDFAKSLGRASYDSAYAVGSVTALSDEALSMGRELGDELPIGLALHRLGVQAEQLPGELGRVRAMAEALQTIGGPAALKDTLAALSPALDQVATKTDESRARVEALVAVLGKGLKPQQAQQVAGQALGLIQARGLDLERLTGKKVFDENGQIKDPTEALAEYQKLMRRKWGGNTAGMRRAAISALGPQLAAVMMNSDFSQVSAMASATDGGKTTAEAERFRQTAEGKRMAAELERQRGLRGAGRGVAGVMDSLNDTLGPWGSMGATYLAGRGLERIAAGLMSSGGSGGGGAGVMSGLAGTGFGSLFAMGGAFVGAGAMQAKVLTEIGQDRESMGKDWRSAHSVTVGKEIAMQALSRGDLSPVIGKAQGDPAAIAVALETLGGKMDQLNETLKTQVSAGLAAELRKNPLKVLVPPSPSRSN